MRCLQPRQYLSLPDQSKITKDTIIIDVLRAVPQSANLFFEIGMHCLGCPSASGESVAEACAVHGEDADALVARINAFFLFL